MVRCERLACVLSAESCAARYRRAAKDGRLFGQFVSCVGCPDGAARAGHVESDATCPHGAVARASKDCQCVPRVRLQLAVTL